MFGLDLVLIGFLVSLGAKGGIDTYDGAKEIITDALGSDTVHGAIEKAKGTAQTIVDEFEKGATAAKTVVVDGAEKAKSAVKETVSVIHEAVDSTLNLHKGENVRKDAEREPNEDRIGALGDEAKGAAAA